MSYNGWRNRETWVVGLWMSNSQGDHEYWDERAKALAKEYGSEAKYELAGEIEDWVTDLYDSMVEMALDPSRYFGMVIDLVPDIPSMNIDFVSLAEAYLEDYVKSKSPRAKAKPKAKKPIAKRRC